jgi:hypothetical protein
MENPPELVIKAGHTESQYWQDLWRYRELRHWFRTMGKSSETLLASGFR